MQPDRLIIYGGRLAQDTGLLPGQLLLDGDTIAATTTLNGATASTDDGAQLDAEGCVVLPGLIDLHVHGAVGADTMDADPAALARHGAFLCPARCDGLLSHDHDRDRASDDGRSARGRPRPERGPIPREP